VISVTAGERSKPVELELKQENGKLVSTNTPSGWERFSCVREYQGWGIG